MSDKPKGLAARLNKTVKPKPSVVPTEPVDSNLTSNLTVKEPELDPIVPIVEPTRNIGAWSKGIDSIRSAVQLPNPVIAKPAVTKVSTSLSQQSNKDHLGYITDEDDFSDEEDFYP